MRLWTNSLVKYYGSRKVVDNVSIEVSQGEIVGLLGPNGAGKTTIFYMAVGFIKPNEGNVYLEQKEITALPMYMRARLGIGYLPQEASVFRKLSVENNIKAVLELTPLNKTQQKEKLESLIDEFGLENVRHNVGDSLSGGERRRTEIARALATDPKFILLDEPFAGIDPIAVEDIQMIVAALKVKNIGILITDHNVQETLSITDRAYLMFEGKILKAGSAEELAEDEMVRKVYLGQHFILKKRTGKMKNIFTCLSFLILVIGCTTSPVPPSSSSREAIDSIYNRKIFLLQLGMDSTCAQLSKDYFKIAVDSIMTARQTEMNNLVK